MTTLDDAIARRDRNSRLLRAATFGFVLVIVILCALMLAYIVTEQARLREATDQAKTSAAAIADCTTPHGKCYERGRTQTGKAVEQIINALNTLEAQRATTSAALNHGQDQIKAAVRQLCDAQGLACPSIP